LRQILHVSDIHFGPYFENAVADGVLDLIERRRPDLVVISGDLTQRAKPRQFRDARAWVDRLPVPSIAVPGNHDVPMYRALFLERLVSPYGAYRRHFADNMEPEWEDDELVVVGVNTAHNWTIKDGRLTRGQLERLATRFAAVPPGKARIVVAHHQLTPPPRFDSRTVLRNARRAVELFARLDVELVLSGHLHQTWVDASESYYPSERRPFWILYSGTTTSRRGRGCEEGRFSANWIDVDDDTWTFSHLLWDEVVDRFVVRSRHVHPRRQRDLFGLDVV